MRLNEFTLLPQGNPEKSRTNKLTQKSLQVLKAQLQRLKQGGANLQDPNEYAEQIGAWASKFFKTDYKIDATRVNAANVKQFVKQLVGRKLAQVNLNTGRPDQQVSTTATPNTLAGTAQQQNNVPHQVNPSTAPVGAKIKVNGGIYTKAQQGWMTEKNQPVVNPKSIQYLDDQYRNATNTQRVI
jgi:hypothetical protein